MTSDVRAELIGQIERGLIPVRDLAGLTRADICAIERVGRAAFETGRYEKAIAIFAGLESIEPDRPEHIMRRAYAEASAGEREQAMHTVTRYLELETSHPAAELTRALIFRAQLALPTDPESARADLRLAQTLAETWPEARAVLEKRR